MLLRCIRKTRVPAVSSSAAVTTPVSQPFEGNWRWYRGRFYGIEYDEFTLGPNDDDD